MSMGEVRLMIEPTRCDGCRLCELACSFKKYKEFNPEKSAIKVFRKEKQGIYFPIVSPFAGVLLDDEKKPIFCDLCGGKPKCVEWCPNNVIYLNKLTAPIYRGVPKS